METGLKKQIEEANLPQILKEYLLRNHHVHMYLTASLIDEIEDIYIEYSILYEFDEAEFCIHIISGIRKLDKHEYFYHYLKKVLDNSLIKQTKSSKVDHQKMVEVEKNIKIIPEKQIYDQLKALLMTLQRIQKSDENRKKDVFLAYTLTGHLEMLFKLYPNNVHYKDFDETVGYLIEATQ